MEPIDDLEMTQSITTTQAPEATLELSPEAQMLLNRLINETKVEAANIITHQKRVVEVTVAELRAAILSNPSHPKAKEFASATGQFPGSQTVCVEQVDLQAVLQNLIVVEETEVIDGEKIRTKRFLYS